MTSVALSKRCGKRCEAATSSPVQAKLRLNNGTPAMAVAAVVELMIAELTAAALQ